MEQNRFWELVARKKSGESTPEEQLEMHQYIVNHPSNGELLQHIDAFWNHSLPAAEPITDQQSKNAWNNIQQKIFTEKPTDITIDFPAVIHKKKSVVFLRMTAVAAALTGLVWLSWLYNGRQQGNLHAKKNIVSTKNGSKSKIELPDGTQVWLNAGSQLTYDESYGKEGRELELIGEAFFDVVHNAALPFVIKTSHMNVKVLGTAFNVRAYPGDLTSEASLIRGSIEVSFPGRPSEKLILKPQQKLTIINKDSVSSNDIAATAPIVKSTRTVNIPVISLSALSYDQRDSAVIETSWMLNKMIFRKKDFGELAKDMERWFNISIQFADSTLADRKFTGTFYNENIKEALGALQLSYPFRYKFDKNEETVWIYSK